MVKAFWKTCVAGLILIVPAWATLLILSTLFTALDSVVGRYLVYPLPGLGLLVLGFIIIVVGVVGDIIVARGLFERLKRKIERIPVIQGIYLTLKGMTILIKFRSRLGRAGSSHFHFRVMDVGL